MTMWQNIKNMYHLGIAVLANLFYGFPGKKLTIVGVTGTDGKTTTTNIIYHILKENKYPVSLISTVSAVIHGKLYDTGFHVTNPAPFALQHFLAEAVSSGDKYLVLEVTSHGINQNRVWGIPFTIGVLTNITHEHLDYHKTYENYVKTKVSLLNRAKKAIINQDDESFPLVQKYLKNNNVLFCTKKDLQTLVIPSYFLGTYNEYNAYEAFLACSQVGLSKKQIEAALKTFVFPKGRGEIVYKKEFTVMIDFAHTPHSFEVLLPEIKKQTKGKLIHVFGAAAKRDETKRPLMGEIASRYDDVIILTSEDPRNENPEHIMDNIEEGVHKRNGLQILRIPDRRKAIAKAIEIAQKGDMVVTTGKAHESSMNYGHGEEPWDEFEAVKKALRTYA